LQRSGKDIISFCIGQPDFPTPEHVQDAAIEAIRGGKHGYTPSAASTSGSGRRATSRDLTRSWSSLRTRRRTIFRNRYA
jgi:aspartate/methionine/tyrosine aminotransferase